ncbi:hypothetical protein V5O39_03230 [Pseudomonas parakoreensis]
MSTQINGLAPQRMHWIGLLAAILVWVLGVTEVGGNVTIWFFKKDEMLASLLYAFAEGSPQLLDPFVEGALLDPDTWLSSTVTALIVFLDFLPVVLSAYALWLTGLFFCACRAAKHGPTATSGCSGEWAYSASFLRQPTR